MALGVGCGLIFGVAPALQLSRVEPQTALRSGARTAGRSGLRNALMGVEVGLALVVLLAAALFFRSFSETRDADPGLQARGRAARGLRFHGAERRRRRSPATSRARLLERLRALPGVEAAAIAAAVPLDIHGLPLRSFALEGRARSDAAPDQALTNTVTPGYFATMGDPAASRGPISPISATRRRRRRRSSTRSSSAASSTAAEPLGRRLESRGTNYAIVGVVRNSTQRVVRRGADADHLFLVSRSPVGARRDPPPDARRRRIAARAGGASASCGSSIPSLPVYDVRTLTEHVEKNLFLRRIPARMFVVLGPLLLVLAAIGIYAVVAYAVAQRTTEIGVRLALGATAGRVVSQIVGESLRVIGAGALVGWLIALVVALHLVRGPIDPSVFVGVPARPAPRRRVRLLAAGAPRDQRRRNGRAPAGLSSQNLPRP